MRCMTVNYPKMALKKHFKDKLETSLKSVGVDPDTWEAATHDRTAWHTTLHKGAATSEEARKHYLQNRRDINEELVIWNLHLE